jgi:hypothetical protein
MDAADEMREPCGADREMLEVLYDSLMTAQRCIIADVEANC